MHKYTAGIVLTGTEIKSIRISKSSIAESFCEFNDKGELFAINMTIGRMLLEITLYYPNKIDSPEAFIYDTKGKTLLLVGYSNPTPAFVDSIIGQKKYAFTLSVFNLKFFKVISPIII